MNPFKAIGRAVAAPVRRTARLLKIRERADDALQIAEEAEADPRLYRDARWWARLLTAGRELLAVLPVPQEIRDMKFLQSILANSKTTFAGIALLATAAAKVAADPATAFEQDTIGMVIAGIGLILGKDVNVSGGPVKVS